MKSHLLYPRIQPISLVRTGTRSRRLFFSSLPIETVIVIRPLQPPFSQPHACRLLLSFSVFLFPPLTYFEPLADLDSAHLGTPPLLLTFCVLTDLWSVADLDPFLSQLQEKAGFSRPGMGPLWVSFHLASFHGGTCQTLASGATGAFSPPIFLQSGPGPSLFIFPSSPFRLSFRLTAAIPKEVVYLARPWSILPGFFRIADNPRTLTTRSPGSLTPGAPSVLNLE